METPAPQQAVNQAIPAQHVEVGVFSARDDKEKQGGAVPARLLCFFLQGFVIDAVQPPLDMADDRSDRPVSKRRL
ncbi:hypothetical protein [Anoxybacillus flavithermus]|uniref:hypothetical protein n=1 Tax=Anoxybacillus flavithermus TaxID=33934 RepID=UPI0007D915D1|nr:hypothetical protein [Anoxybacillus flavithermus]MBE2913967.1 hypothetical protein [Anoxybacillus flavithermus]MBE2941414.1 hypothetical protein [Anoxybacillus flavithermus]MBE2943871.1 hypothetical protein [Anoxybacillus flavithermus]MBE2960185.1 hypothetical protein [Anoxybacillus flavithermus]OAO81683.1 hypothetical protein A0O32_1054 [Anoxybacillus flavithermus]